ncbi:MAG TPA: GspE/PulE family protein [Burkholderiaceae bacterium]|jgi:MSHA biogenesis protein MshE
MTARLDQLRIGDLLVEQGVITGEQLERALLEQRESGRKLGRLITESGWATEEQIAVALSRQLRVPYVDLSRRHVNPEVARLLPEMQARRLRALAVDDTGTTVLVAMADPSDPSTHDELQRLIKRPLALAVAAETPLVAALDVAYQGGRIAGLAKVLSSEITSVEAELGDLLGLQGAGTQDAPVARLLITMFEEALRLGASDIHIEPMEQHLRIRYRIDGELHVQMEADSRIAAAVALRLKLMAGLDISEKRLPQDGCFAVKLRQVTVDMRLSTMPTQHGESVVMRMLNQDSRLLQLSALALPPPVEAALRRALAKPAGMVLVTGPTGSGKTTTLYAAMNELNSTGCKIITVEDPVEYRMPGLNQVQVQEKIELGFDRVLRAALRQDPDVVLVGEMRDQQTAETGMRAAMTGHLVLSTLHTNDAAATPLRLMDMGVPRYMVASSLQLVLAQRLLRLVCTHCAETHRPTERETAWMRAMSGSPDLAPDPASLRTGRGCPRCHGTGHAGRVGLFEFIEMDSEMARAVGYEDPDRLTEISRRKMGHHTLGRQALKAALEGRATVADAMGVTGA